MSNQCVKCDESWIFDDFVCPCCGSAAVYQGSYAAPTLKYVIFKTLNGIYEYDVIRISTGKSIFSKPKTERGKKE